MLNCSNTI